MFDSRTENLEFMSPELWVHCGTVLNSMKDLSIKKKKTIWTCHAGPFAAGQ